MPTFKKTRPSHVPDAIASCVPKTIYPQMPIPLKLVMRLLGQPMPEEYMTPEEAIGKAFGRIEDDNLEPPIFEFRSIGGMLGGPEGLIDTGHSETI